MGLMTLRSTTSGRGRMRGFLSDCRKGSSDGWQPKSRAACTAEAGGDRKRAVTHETTMPQTYTIDPVFGGTKQHTEC